MKKIFLLSIMFIFSVEVYASEVSFDSIQNRVSRRDKETKAILDIDKGLRFRIKINNNTANINIWRNMKIADPNRESYSFKVTPAIQLEYHRILLYKKLLALRKESEKIESTYRINRFFDGFFKKGMPVEEVKKILGQKKYTIHDYAKAGAMSISCEGYYFIFESFGLFDIVKDTIRQSDHRPEGMLYQPDI